MALTRYIEIKVESSKAKTSVDSLDKSMVNLGKDTDTTSAAMGALSKAAAAVAAALSVSKVIAYADAWTTVNNKLSNSTKAHEDLAEVTQRVFDIAQETRSSLDATATLYSRLERATRDYGTSAEDLIKLTTLINQGFIISGATTAEATNAIIQLSQGIASGVLRGEEFNSVNEQGNRLIVALAASLGKTSGEMRQLANDGQLTTDVIVKGLLNQSSVIENEYSNTVATFAQRTEVATQNLTKFIGESVLVQSSVAAFGDTMILASENIDTLIDIATALSVIYAARLAPAVIASVSSITALIASQTAATITTNVLGQRTVVATASMNAFAVASRGASAALALVGGPAGLLILTIYGMTQLLKASRDTTTQMDLFAQKTKDAEESLKGLTVAQANFKLSSIEGELIVASAKMGALQAEAKRTGDAFKQELFKGKESGLVILEQQAKAADAALKETSDRIVDLAAQASALRGSSLSPLVAPEATPEAPVLGEGKQKKKKIPTPDLPDEEYSERYLQAQVNQTQATFQELQNRLALFTDYTVEINKLEAGSYEQSLLMLEADASSRSAQAALDLSNKVAEIEEERQLLLDNDRITAEARQELLLQLEEQKLLAAEIYEQSLTEIAEAGSAARTALKKQELSQQISTYSNYANAALSLESAFGSKSEKAQKRRRKAAVVIDTAAGIARAYAENNFYVATGMAAALAANGIAQIAAINSASSAPAASVSASVASSSPTTEAAPTSTTVFDFRSRDGQFFTAQDVVDILSSVEGAVVINNSLGNAARVGEI